MADAVELAFRSAAARLIPHGSAGLVAVSGGGDSVALLHLLARAATTRGLRLTVAHLDHGLRRGSAADRRFVERLAGRLSLECIAERRDVSAARRRDESPAEAARRIRREFLVQAARSSGSTWIAVGHTRDDQAETILMRLVRGAGATALTGMAERGPGAFVRPLLELDRHVLRNWLDHRGIRHREDPSNRDLRYDRNRVRRLALPTLAETLNPRAAANLVKAARRFREDAEYLDALAAEFLERAARIDRRGEISLDSKALAAAPPPIARRAALMALRRGGADPRRIASRHVEGLIDLASGAGGREIHLPSGLRAHRLRGRIFVRRRS